MKLKKKVIGKITKIELGYLKQLIASRSGLIRLIGLTESTTEKFWKEIKKEYNFPKEAKDKIKIDTHTRELYFEKWE